MVSLYWKHFFGKKAVETVAGTASAIGGFFVEPMLEAGASKLGLPVDDSTAVMLSLAVVPAYYGVKKVAIPAVSCAFNGTVCAGKAVGSGIKSAYKWVRPGVKPVKKAAPEAEEVEEAAPVVEEAPVVEPTVEQQAVIETFNRVSLLDSSQLNTASREGRMAGQAKRKDQIVGFGFRHLIA